MRLTHLPLLPIIVSQHEVELLVGGLLVEGNNVGEDVDVTKPLPEDAEQGVLGDVVDHVQGAGGTQVPLPVKRGINSRKFYICAFKRVPARKNIFHGTEW